VIYLRVRHSIQILPATAANNKPSVDYRSSADTAVETIAIASCILLFDR